MLRRRMPARDPSRGTGAGAGKDRGPTAGDSGDFADTVMSPGDQLEDLLASSAPAGDADDPDLDAATILGVGGQARPSAAPEPPAPRPRTTAPQARVAAEGGRRPAPPEPRAQTRPAPSLSASDPAPIFRNDLQVARTASGYIIRDPSSGKTFPF